MNADPTHSFLRESRRCRPLPHAVRAGPRAERCPSLGRAWPGSGRAVGAAAQAALPPRGPAEAGPGPCGPPRRGNSPGREGRGAGGVELRRGCSCAGKGVMSGGSIHGTGRDGTGLPRSGAPILRRSSAGGSEVSLGQGKPVAGRRARHSAGGRRGRRRLREGWRGGAPGESVLGDFALLPYVVNRQRQVGSNCDSAWRSRQAVRHPSCSGCPGGVRRARASPRLRELGDAPAGVPPLPAVQGSAAQQVIQCLSCPGTPGATGPGCRLPQAGGAQRCRSPRAFHPPAGWAGGG